MAIQQSRGGRGHVAVPGDQFAWALGGLCALHRVPFDADLILRHTPPPYTIENLIETLRALGFHAAQVATETVVNAATFPCIAFRRASESGALIVAIISRREDDVLTIFDATSSRPMKLYVTQALAAFEPRAVVAARS